MQAIFAIAIAVGSWIHVLGDAWQPNQAALSDARVKLQSYAVAQAKLRHDELSPWSTYTFQYQGRDLDGRKVIYVNAFCSDPPEYTAREMVLVLDGGACYFQAYYDIQTKSFVSIGFNGLA